MVKPGVNQVLRMPRSLRNFRMRGAAVVAPNSPRDSGVGVIMPRAMKPDWVSKSNVKQTMWRGIQVLQLLWPATVHHTRHARPCAGHPRLSYNEARRGWPG